MRSTVGVSRDGEHASELVPVHETTPGPWIEPPVIAGAVGTYRAAESTWITPLVLSKGSARMVSNEPALLRTVPLLVKPLTARVDRS